MRNYSAEKTVVPFRHLVGTLRETVRGSRGHYAMAAFCVVCASAFAYAIPLILRFAIDSVIDGADFSLPFRLGKVGADAPVTAWLRRNLWGCGILMLVAATGQGVADYGRASFAATASEGFARRLRNRLFNHVGHLPFQTLARLETGDLIQRCTSARAVA